MTNHEKRWRDFSGVSLVVHPDEYWFTAKNPPEKSNVFLVSNEFEEQTTIFSTALDHAKLPTDVVGPYILFEFQIPNPFQMPGFLAGLTEQVASLGKPVLVYSAYSKDYLFIRKNDSKTIESRIREWLLKGNQ